MTDPEKHLVTPLIFDDEPVEGSERAYFQFDAYANTLAHLITARTVRTPLTVGVFGEWGTGKTTLLRPIQACLDEIEELGVAPISFLDSPEHDGYRHCRTVWFNAWKYGHEKEILVALVEAILRQMRDDGFIQWYPSRTRSGQSLEAGPGTHAGSMGDRGTGHRETGTTA